MSLIPKPHTPKPRLPKPSKTVKHTYNKTPRNITPHKHYHKKSSLGDTIGGVILIIIFIALWAYFYSIT
jgi:hypothetical protein